jgi:two-component system LytT family response regulator
VRRVLIADDEGFARCRLRQLLSAHADMQVVAECANGLQAAGAIVALQPDLLFLDVDMPECSGLELVRRLGRAAMPATIFSTAHEQFALAAFEADALDYLLKPYDQARLDRALDKARQLPARQPAPTAWGERILVRAGAVQQMLAVADIQYIAAEGNYVRLHAASASWLLRERLAGVLERLDAARFRRIHRSHIVNLDHVCKVLPWFGGDALVLMADGCKLRLSRNFRAALATERS